MINEMTKDLVNGLNKINQGYYEASGLTAEEFVGILLGTTIAFGFINGVSMEDIYNGVDAIDDLLRAREA